MIDYDFTNRMSKNYRISKQKEEKCEVKIVDFIFENIKKHKLFLTQDHPTSFVFNEVVRQICEILNIDYDYKEGLLVDDNITQMRKNV